MKLLHLFSMVALPVYAAQHYVTVPIENIQSIRKLVEQGHDVAGVNWNKKTATILTSELERTKSLRPIRTRALGRPDSGYKTITEVERILVDAENLYPHLMTVEKLGSTDSGRPVYAAKLTAKFVFNPEGKPTILIDAMHHAREVMTTEVALDIIDYLTKNYATDTKVQEWLNQYEVWVIPMLNPDGNDRVWNGNSGWRKNTSHGYGVDINRNYPFAWNTCNGSSGSTSSETYRGPSAGSESETKLIMSLARRIQPKFNLSYHSFSEIVIYPFGCSPKKVPSPDREIYENYGKELAKKLVRDSGSGTYRPGTSYELLYNVDGGSVDWMYSDLKIMSYVVEINSDSQGFQPSYTSWRDKTVERQRAGWQYLLNQMAGPDLPSRTVADVTHLK